MYFSKNKNISFSLSQINRLTSTSSIFLALVVLFATQACNDSEFEIEDLKSSEIIMDIDDDNDGILDIHEMIWSNSDDSYIDIDTDDDGIVDRLDIDSDADGIPDNIEWQQTIAEGVGHKYDQGFSYIAPSGIDENEDGLDDAYDSQIAGVYYKAWDTDLDGTPDFQDFDSDNDGIEDAIEGNDSNGDGIADVNPLHSDVDMDGLDDAFDTFNLLNTNEDLLTNISSSNAPLPDLGNTGKRDWREEFGYKLTLN